MSLGGKHRLLGPQAPLFLGGATSLCLPLIAKAGWNSYSELHLSCYSFSPSQIHFSFTKLSHYLGYFSLCVCVLGCVGIFVPLHLLVPWSGSGQIAQKSPAAHQICLKVLKTYPHLTRKSLVASSGRDCHCLTVKIRMGMMVSTC